MVRETPVLVSQEHFDKPRIDVTVCHRQAPTAVAGGESPKQITPAIENDRGNRDLFRRRRCGQASFGGVDDVCRGGDERQSADGTTHGGCQGEGNGEPSPTGFGISGYVGSSFMPYGIVHLTQRSNHLDISSGRSATQLRPVHVLDRGGGMRKPPR